MKYNSKFKQMSRKLDDFKLKNSIKHSKQSQIKRMSVNMNGLNDQLEDFKQN